MFNLWPKKKSVDEILEDANLQPLNFTWTSIPDDSSKKDAVIKNLREQQEFLYKENEELKKILENIAEDGTYEHNNAIKLRQEVASLKAFQEGLIHERDTARDLLTNLTKDLEDQKQLKDSLQRVNKKYIKSFIKQADFISELTKEVNGLRHLKIENVELIERLNAVNKDLIRWEKWEEVCDYINNHDELKAHGFIVHKQCLRFLKERDEQKAEIERLKKDIQDYIFEKSDEYNTLKALYERAKKVVEGVEVDLDKSLDEQSDKEPQKHPMYPLHWGGYDKEVEFQGEWKCPCNVCKEDNTSEDKVTSDLALRVTKLESQIKNLTSSCRDI